MNTPTQNFELPFYTIGELEGFSDDATIRTAHIDIPAHSLTVAVSLQSARQWLLEQHAGVDMECAAELPLRGHFAFNGPQITQSFDVDSAQLVAIDEGFVVRVHLDNGVYVETDVLAPNLP